MTEDFNSWDYEDTEYSEKHEEIEKSVSLDNTLRQEDFNLLESSHKLVDFDYNSINSAESFLHCYSGELTIDDVNESIQSASDFFNIESPLIVTEGWTTGIFTRDLTTVSDDVFIFNSDQLLNMGITEKEGLDLVMTHENTHRALQGLNMGLSEHQEELCCDFMSGVRAGLNSMDTTQMINSLSNTTESITHPAGELRVEAIKEGELFATNFIAENGNAPTFYDCLQAYKTSDAFSQTTDPLVIVRNIGHQSNEFHGYTQADVDWYEHQARITSGSEQAHWLKEAKWARDHIHSFVSDDMEESMSHKNDIQSLREDIKVDNISFHGASSDKEWLEYYQDKLKNAVDNQNHHLKKAEEFASKGDESGYKDRKARADSWGSDVTKYTRLVREYEAKVKK